MKGFESPKASREVGNGERRELLQWGPGRSPSRKRIPELSQRHRMPLVEMSVVNCKAFPEREAACRREAPSPAWGPGLRGRYKTDNGCVTY